MRAGLSAPSQIEGRRDNREEERSRVVCYLNSTWIKEMGNANQVGEKSNRGSLIARKLLVVWWQIAAELSDIRLHRPGQLLYKFKCILHTKSIDPSAIYAPTTLGNST